MQHGRRSIAVVSLAVIVLLASSQATLGLRLLGAGASASPQQPSRPSQDTLPPIPEGDAAASTSPGPADGSPSPSPNPSTSPSPASASEPVAIHVDSPPDSPAQSDPGEAAGRSPAPPADTTPDTAGAAFTSGNVPAPTPAVKESQSPIRQSPWPSSPSQGSVHLPDMPSADRSALLHAIDLPALQQEPSLTALISPDSSARTGTFTPPGAGAALTCRVPELLAIQPGLEVRARQTVMAAAVMGPLTGNSCSGDGTTPFVGCPAGFFCPTPARRLLCPAGMFCPMGSAHPRRCPALAACPAGSAQPGFNAGAFITIILIILAYLALFFTARQFLRRRASRERQQQGGRSQLRSLLSAQSRATEGFVFQGLDHIRDHAEVSLNDLSIACPCSGRPALKGVSGKLQHYRLTAVVGPRGADISGLMRLLAGRAPGGSVLLGSVRTVLGGSCAGCRSVVGYATAEAALLGDLTNLENLEYACRLRQPITTTAHQRHRIVGDVVRLLHLQEACDGLAGQQGSSSSLSWRLSLAMELVASPSILIIDGAHPSNDAFQDLLYMEVLQLLTSLGMTIVTTALPRRVYEEQPPHVDLLLLGHEGGTVYNGPLRLTTPYFLSIGLGKYGGNITQESLQEFLSSPDGSIPFLDGQTLADAWNDRMADPWTQKTLKQSPGNGAEGGLSPEQNLMSYIEPGRPAELSSVLTAILQALRDFTCHPSGAGQMTEKTEVSLHDLVALTQALGVPCSPEAASCMLLNAHAAAKLGHAGQGASGQLTKRDLAKHDTHSSSSDCILNVKDVLLRDSDKLLGQDGLACKVSVTQLAAWLAQQDGGRRKHAGQAHGAQRSTGASETAAPAVPCGNPWLAALNTGHQDATDGWEASDKDFGIDIQDVDPEAFKSINLENQQSITPTCSELLPAPKGSTLLEKILRAGSGRMLPESLPQEQKPAGSQYQPSRSSLSCEGRLQEGQNFVNQESKSLPDAGDHPLPLRQRTWGAPGGLCMEDRAGSTASAASSGVSPDAERGTLPGGALDDNSPREAAGKHNAGHSIFQGTTSAVKKALKIPRSNTSEAGVPLKLGVYRSRRQPGFLRVLYYNMLRASLRWTRHISTLLHSLVLCAGVACIVGLLCAASFDISGIPAVHVRVVFALFMACAPFALRPFAGVRSFLAKEGAPWLHSVAFFLGTALLDLVNVIARPLVFGGVLTWMVPTYAGYDWHAVALIMVSWYTATAGYAASASLAPTSAVALLLSALFCGVLLLSGATAPTLRTMFKGGRFFYGLSALGLGRWSVELSTIAEYSGLDNALQHLAMFKMAQMGYCGLEGPRLPGRMDSRDDMAVFVSNAINPLALQTDKFTSMPNILGAAQRQIGSKLAGGLTCVLQNAVAGGSGPNCIMQLCHQQTNKDVLALFLLGLALCAVALLALLRVPWRIAAAAFRARRCAMTALKKMDRRLSSSQ